MGKLPDGEIASDRPERASEESPASADTDEAPETDVDNEMAADSESGTEPDAQPAELRRQQRLVAIGIAVLGGAALAISAVQQFPDRSLFFPVVSGLFGGVVLFWLVSKGLVTTGDDEE